MTNPSPQPAPPDALSYALAYAGLGWRVVPILPGGKRPSLEAWQNEATTDPDVIRFWWTRNPDHGVGIVTGSASGIFVLDVDPDHGGGDTLADLEERHGRLPDTVEAQTGGGGRHLLFRWPVLSDQVALRNSAGRLGPGLDIRAEGGQIVAAPTIHPASGRPYEWELSSLPGETPLAEAPAWLIDLLTERQEALPEGQVEGAFDVRYAWDRANGHLQVQERSVGLLKRHGWHSPRTDRNGVTYLTRPGKARGAGAGCSVGKVAPGVAYCFTSEAPPLEAEKGYRYTDLLATLEHGGDRVETDRALVAELGGARTHFGPGERGELEAWIDHQHTLAQMRDDTGTSHNVDIQHDGNQPIDWPSFWTREHSSEDWLVEPILPKGRSVALWAKHKTGKSLITLELAAALATGREAFLKPAGEPQHVVYLDMEMTEDDLCERLEEMGYGPDDDLGHLHYYLLPALPPLDTEAGGREVLAIAERHGAVAVVIDTMSRVITGEENSADTIRAYYRHTGQPLKARAISVIRLDHGGKDATKGQRGTSGKGDDVDVIWQLRAVDGGFELKRDAARMSWVPEQVVLHRQDGPLRHTINGGKGWHEGTRKALEEMRAMGIDLANVTQNKAISLYKQNRGTLPRGAARDAWRFLRSGEMRRDELAEWLGGGSK